MLLFVIAALTIFHFALPREPVTRRRSASSGRRSSSPRCSG